MGKYITVTRFIILSLALAGCNGQTDKPGAVSRTAGTDSLPPVLSGGTPDITYRMLRYEAAMRFAMNQLPVSLKDWEDYREKLRSQVISKAGVRIDHSLPLDIMETGSVKMKNYVIRNIIFQTRPGVYATANLYVPDGDGPFPAVINMLGHWRKGKIDASGPQAVGHTLAARGYVCLTVDPWGAGERSTRHGDFEYHGSNLGASLMNIGEPLIGMQISDNMRGVDLLCSLPVVDSTRIGATGASGGGNQTMWLSAVDTRIRADVPVVSVGTFEAYIMESNCICEQLPDGLTFTEEAGIIALSNAPLLINHDKDSNPTFYPSETRKTYANAAKIFSLQGKDGNIAFRHFDLEHGYEREDREAMLGWFDLHLKGIGDGSPAKEVPFEQVPEEKLMVYPEGKRDSLVMSTDTYCRLKGTELRNKYLNTKSFSREEKGRELKDLLKIENKLTIDSVYRFPDLSGWERIVVKGSDKRIIPLILLGPGDGSSDYIIVFHPGGRSAIPKESIDSLLSKGTGIVMPDLIGTGELASSRSADFDQTGKLHTLSRAELWLGRTVLGEWISEIDLVVQYLAYYRKAERISFEGYQEGGLAGLFYAALGGKVEPLAIVNAPVSYLFDNRETVDYFGMGIHLPGILKWGDISLAAALSRKNIVFRNPVTMSGENLSIEKVKDYQAEYDIMRTLCREKGSIEFR